MRRVHPIMEIFSSRVFIDFLLALLAMLTPWWFSLLAGALFFFIFDGFVELLFLALLIDLLYGSPLPRFFGSPFVLSLAVVPLYFLLSALKQKMRF
ncbi:MAG: hypothetical protein Q7R64_03285 [bacterium]|nr:hypothetical protein [bacterium]